MRGRVGGLRGVGCAVVSCGLGSVVVSVFEGGYGRMVTSPRMCMSGMVYSLVSESVRLIGEGRERRKDLL